MGYEKQVMICPLIGLTARIVSSSSKELLGLDGKIIDETKNTIVIESNEKIRKIPKKGKIFEVTFKDEKIKIKGDHILFKPEEKAKNIRI